MTHILIAGRPIGDYVESRFGHLFLVLSDDLTLSEDDLVIRGGPDGSFIWSTLQGQVSVVLDQTNGSFANVARLLDINEVDAFDFYATGEIPIPTYDAATIWRILSDVASQVLANGFTYSALSENSNSFVGTLLSVIGIESAGTAWFRYPAVGHTLSSDFFTGSNFSYVIRGADIMGVTVTSTPIGDRLFALNANTPFAPWATGDFVTTFGGNDELHDGNRKDTLEGGTGDDTYVLQDDGAADIIITGEGDDTIRGGGAEDRLVLRIDILDQMYEDWKAQLEHSNENYGTNYVLTGDALLKSSERLGEDAATSGLPILGGFWNVACDGEQRVRLNTGSFYPTVFNPAGASH